MHSDTVTDNTEQPTTADRLSAERRAQQLEAARDRSFEDLDPELEDDWSSERARSTLDADDTGTAASDAGGCPSTRPN